MTEILISLLFTMLLAYILHKMVFYEAVPQDDSFAERVRTPHYIGEIKELKAQLSALLKFLDLKVVPDKRVIVRVKRKD